MLLRRQDGGPMVIFLDRLRLPERTRLACLVSEHGGEVVVNPARHPCCVTFGEGKPGSQPRPPLSDRQDTFSTRFLDDCVRVRRIVDLCQYRLQESSRYAEPDRARDVLLGLVAWSQLAEAAAAAAADRSSEDEFQLLSAGPEVPQEQRGRGAGAFHGRQKFSREKDEALVRFVGEHGLLHYAPPTGPKFWQLKAHLLPECLASHPTLSLHTHFIKQVRPRLAEFKSSVPLRLVVAVAAAAGVRLPLTDDERRQLRERPQRADSRPEQQPLRRQPTQREEREERQETERDERQETEREERQETEREERQETEREERHETEREERQETEREERHETEREDRHETERRSLSPAFDSSALPGPGASRPTPAEGNTTRRLRKLCRFDRSEVRVAVGSASSPSRKPTDVPPPHGRQGGSSSPEPEPGPSRLSAYLGRPLGSPAPSPQRTDARDSDAASRSSTGSEAEPSSPPDRRREVARRPASDAAPAAKRTRRSSADAESETDDRTSRRNNHRDSPSGSGVNSCSADRHDFRTASDSESSCSGSVLSSTSEDSAEAVASRGRRPAGPRQAYTAAEEDVLLRQVLRLDARGAALGGRRAWQRLERRRLLPGRTWQSLKQHWRCIMAPRLRHDPRLTARQQRRLCAAPRPRRRPVGRPRRPYTRAEDAEILRYLEAAPRRARRVGGRRLWQDMERRLSADRSWQSLKERFLKQVAPNLARFEEVAVEFRRGLQRQLFGE